jgi:hypothetical protein
MMAILLVPDALHAWVVDGYITSVQSTAHTITISWSYVFSPNGQFVPGEKKFKVCWTPYDDPDPCGYGEICTDGNPVTINDLERNRPYIITVSVNSCRKKVLWGAWTCAGKGYRRIAWKTQWTLSADPQPDPPEPYHYISLEMIENETVHAHIIVSNPDDYAMVRLGYKLKFSPFDLRGVCSDWNGPGEEWGSSNSFRGWEDRQSDFFGCFLISGLEHCRKYNFMAFGFTSPNSQGQLLGSGDIRIQSLCYDSIDNIAQYLFLVGQYEILRTYAEATDSYYSPSYTPMIDARGVAVFEGDSYAPYACVAAADSGLYLLNTEWYPTPMLLSRHDTPGFAYDVAVSDLGLIGPAAYVADGDAGLAVIDSIGNPADADYLGNYDTPGTAYGIDIYSRPSGYWSGPSAYIADGESGLEIYYIGDFPLQHVASYDTLWGGTAYDVAVSGDYAYVANGDQGLLVVDLTDLGNPSFAGIYVSPGTARGVAVSGTHAYVAAGNAGLHVFDILDPTDPLLVGTYNTPGTAYGVSIAGDSAYVADGDAGLQVIDVGNPASPVLAWSYDTPGTAYASNAEVATTDSMVYVADGHTGLILVDCIDFSDPHQCGRYDPAGSPTFQHIADENPFLYEYCRVFSRDGERTGSTIALLSWLATYFQDIYIRWQHEIDLIHAGLDMDSYVLNHYRNVYVAYHAEIPGEHGPQDEPVPMHEVPITGPFKGSDLPDRFRLFQNAPNPFNPSTEIRYDVPAGGGHVKLSIFDVSGRLIRTLVNGREDAGYKSVAWDGRDNHGRHAETGVYFYKLEAPGYTQTLKMVLVQ